MNPFAAAGAGVGLLSAGLSFWSKGKEAAAQRAMTREQVRRDKLEHLGTVGETKVRGAGSGIEYDSGSLQAYLKNMQDEFARQEQWTLKAGMAQARATQTSAWTGLATDLLGTAFQFGAMNGNFKAPAAAGTAGGGNSYQLQSMFPGVR